MLNNELVNLKIIIYIAITALAIGFLLYRFDKQAKAIMGNFAALLVVVWDEIRDYFK